MNANADSQPMAAVVAEVELERRPSRPADDGTLFAALSLLAQRLAEPSRSMAHSVAQAAREMCKASAAWIATLETQGGVPILRWLAATDTLPAFAYTSQPLANSAYVSALESGHATLALQAASYEVLVQPLFSENKPGGVLCLALHTGERQFQHEDLRVLAALGPYASIALRYHQLEEDNALLAEQHAAQESGIRHTRAALTSSNERYYDLFNSIDQGFCIVEMRFDEANKALDYCFLEVNPVFERQTGIQHAVGRWMREIAPLHEQYWFDIYGQIALTGEPQRFENAASQLQHYYEVYAFRVGQPHEHQVGILFNDISERKAVERERERQIQRERELRAEAEENNRMKDVFLATVSHELRTPLTAFLGYAQVLQRRVGNDSRFQPTLEKMVNSARAQAKLIEDLLDVARVTSGKLHIAPHVVDLRTIVMVAIDAVRPAVDAKELALHLELGKTASAVFADPDRMQQVVWNLLSNAAKFTPPSGAIHIRLAAAEHQVILSVEDTGIGIGAEFLPYVFDRFRQAESLNNRSSNGLGLGLSIVRHVVELHGGSVEASSLGLGQGSCFRIALPRTYRQPPVFSTPSPGMETSLEGLRVLLVDDQTSILELLLDILKDSGAHMEACSNAQDALAMVRTWRPHILISDLAMPDSDGYWLINAIRTLPTDEGHNTPAIALTANAQANEHVRALSAGFQQYLTKPIEPEVLLGAISFLYSETVAS